MFYFHPPSGEDFQFDSYFSDGLKPPTSSLLIKNPNWVLKESDLRLQIVQNHFEVSTLVLVHGNLGCLMLA